MTASRREAGQENFRDRARQSRGAGAQRDACFPPFSWPVRQCEPVCAASPPAHTLSVNVSMCVLLTPPSAHPVPVTASLLCRSWSSFPVGLA